MCRTTSWTSFRQGFVVVSLFIAPWLAAAALTSSAAAAAPSTNPESNRGSIRGQLTPAHDHDLVLATVSIPDLALKIRIEADGSFHFPSIPEGNYVLEIRVPSVGVTVERVSVVADRESSMEVDLKPGSHFDEIVVTASPDARSALDLASATTSLGGDELALRLQSSLGETLSQEAGVSSTFFGPGASRPLIRGLGGDRVRVLEGGLGTGDASSVSADHAVTVDPAQADRIEVLRGPATLLYGSSAMGGVVNIIDERIPTHRASGGVHGDATIGFGSVDNSRTGTLNLNGGSGRWAWHADVTAREADDYDVPGFASNLEDEDDHEHEDEDEHHEDEDEHHEDEEDPGPFGTVENTNLDAQGGRFGMTYFGERGFLGISVGEFRSEYGLPGGLGHGHEEEEGHDEEEGHEEEEGEEEEEIVRIDMQQRRVDLKGELNLGQGAFQRLETRLGLTDYEHLELEGEEAGTFFFNDSFEGRLELVQKNRTVGETMQHSGSLGLQFFDRDFEAVGAEAFLPPTTTQRWAAFTLQELTRGPWRWQLGARFETQDATPESLSGQPSRSHDGFSTSLGLVWKSSDTFSIATSLARSIKLPAAEELYSDGLHVATQAFEVGDAELTEEVGLGLDVSFRLETEILSGELTFFRQDFDDFIYQAFTGAEAEGFPVVIFRQEDAQLSGVELQARLELLDRDTHHMHLRLVGDFVDAELDAGGFLPRIPPLRLGAGLHYHSENWNASTEVQWVDEQTDVATNETATDGYTLLNASLGYRFLFKSQILDLLLRGRNLTDEDARPHTSFLKSVAPLPGRDVSLSLKFLF